MDALLLLLPTAAAMALSFDRAGAMAALCGAGPWPAPPLEGCDGEDACVTPPRALKADAFTREVAREYAKVVLVLRPEEAEGVDKTTAPAPLIPPLGMGDLARGLSTGGTDLATFPGVPVLGRAFSSLLQALPGVVGAVFLAAAC